MQGRARRTRRGFTLMELMVVIGIIVVMTALSIPAISKFMDGQTLTQGGRIVQSAFNEARRAAITQRAKNYLVLFRQEDPSRPGEYLYGMRRYRERVGYEGEATFLLPGTMFDMIGGTITGGPGVPIAGQCQALGCYVFEGLPSEDEANLFSPGRKPISDPAKLGWLQFEKDGTIRPTGPLATTERTAPADVFDLNEVVELDQTRFDALPALIDLNIRESGDHDVDKRCFIDIDCNTGRVNMRVLQVVREAP
jgi:prepilin-type N-terminal cleavage/methylation domain-containing protein